MNKSILLYDGDCNFCRHVVKLLKKIDKNNKIDIKPMQNFEKTDLKEINSVILIQNNIHYQKSEAIFKTIQITGGFIQVLLLFKIFPKSLLNFIYDLIAHNRYRIFGKTDTCKY